MAGMPGNTPYDAILAAPFGALGIRARDALTEISFLPAARPVAPKTPLAREVCAQLRAYFRDPSFKFDLPLDTDGTEFQQRVWRALRGIRPGRPLTYGRLAERLHSGPRAIGGACRANPVPVVVPCHRVVAAHGLGGFMGGAGTKDTRIKQWLLAHERSDAASAARN
jgi:methylated-DNA-[protein]-cysteine S-methyltransferase